jgi:uncharacterized protein YkwD
MDDAYGAAMSIVCDINIARTQHGVRPLRWDWRLWSAAQRQANDMAARHYAAHVTPDGRDLRDRIEPTGYIPAGASANWLVGENLGWGTGVLSTPLAIVVGWLDSPGHRENMLDPQFQDIGVGINSGAITKNGQSGVIYAAEFGTRGAPADTLRIRGRAGRTRRR